MENEEVKPKIIVVGSGYNNKQAINELSKTYDVAVVDELLKSRDYLEPIQYINTRMLENVFEEKKFKCKGNKHQYSLIGDNYICTCGKKL